jgi:hypothetical protein
VARGDHQAVRAAVPLDLALCQAGSARSAATTIAAPTSVAARKPAVDSQLPASVSKVAWIGLGSRLVRSPVAALAITS